MAEEPRDAAADEAEKKAGAASEAVARIARKQRELSGAAPVLHRRRPSLFGIASALVVLATVVGTLVMILRPPIVEPLAGSWTSPDRSFALRPPESWLVVERAAFDKVTTDAGVRPPEWLRRLVGRNTTVISFLKIVGEGDAFPAVVVGVHPGVAAAGASFKAEASLALSSSLGGLFDSVVVESADDAIVDGLPAAAVSAVGQKKTLLAPAETVYREVEGGYVVDGRTEEKWAIRKTRFVRHSIASHGRVFELTLVADDAHAHRVDIPFKNVVSSFRSLVRPPLLPDEMRQTVIGAAAVAVFGLLTYLAYAIRALVVR